MSKTVCGIDISGSEARLVTLRGIKTSYNVIGNSFGKVKLQDHKNQSEIHSFKQAIQNHFENEGVSSVGIKARATRGDFSGGPLSFKIEGIIQTLEVPVELIHSTTIAATIRKNPLDLNAQDINKYQHEAFKVAYHLLKDN